MKLTLLKVSTSGRSEAPVNHHHAVWRYTKAVITACVLYALPGSASAIVMYDAGALDFESSGQSMWASGEAFRSEESVFLGAQWADRTATIGAIAGSEYVQITPRIPATYSPYIPAVTTRVWEPRRLSDLGNRSEHGGKARPDFHNFEAHSGPT